MQSKEFPGDIVVFTGSNSAVGFCLMTVRYLFLDDGCLSSDEDSEDDPFVIQRYIHFYSQKDFYHFNSDNKRLFKNRKRIWRNRTTLFLCAKSVLLTFSNFKWEGVHYDSSLVEVTSVCETCKGNILDCHKTKMFSKYKMAKDMNNFLWMNKILGKKKKTD